MEEGQILSRELPKDIKRRMERAGIQDPFQCVETSAYEPLDMSFLREER